MALIQRNLYKNVMTKFHQFTRSLSTNNIEKSIFISQSNDVYTNLALEEWMCKNYNFEKHHVMLYYKNDPCILIGKDENPWLATNIINHPETEDNQSVILARRQGDGKTIYEDQGAMNLTFFGTNDHLDKGYNLGVLSRAIFRKFGITVAKDNDDLSFFNMKVSATGFNESEVNSYQNVTLFVDINKNNLQGALQKAKSEQQVLRKSYVNISEIDSHVRSDALLSAIGWEFMRTTPYALNDGGKSLASKQRGFQMINPTEQWFPGLAEIRNRLLEWDWCYGKTPKFIISRSFQVPLEFLENSNDASHELQIKLIVDNGRIDDVTLFIPPGLSSSGFSGEAKVITTLKGQKFSEEALSKIETILSLNNAQNKKERFVTECVKKSMVI